MIEIENLYHLPQVVPGRGEAQPGKTLMVSEIQARDLEATGRWAPVEKKKPTGAKKEREK